MGGRKRVKSKEFADNKKIPRSLEDPEGYLKKHPVWAFQHCDLEHEKWSLLNCEAFYNNIMNKLISYEGMTWAEIQSASGGKKKGTNSHFESISELKKEAQKRAIELHLDVDELFSLRLTGTLRLYGILENGVFSVIWYDPNHEIYPLKNR